MSDHHLEIERKYELMDLSAELPNINWNELDGFFPQEPILEEMNATYFDTESRRLSKAQVAVRRRIGGYDQGWHIKFDDGSQGRHEIHFDVLSQPKRQPAAVARYLQGVTLGEKLVDMVSLKTSRLRTVVLDQNQNPLGEICQDAVEAFDFETQQLRSWNEWEIELINPDSSEVESFFEQCEYLLEEAGIQPSNSRAKIARALGQDPEFERRLGLDSGKKKKTHKNQPVQTGAVLERIIRVALQELSLADLKVRGAVDTAPKEFLESLKQLEAIVAFGLEPYLEDSAVLEGINKAVKNLKTHFEPLRRLQLVRREVDELELPASVRFQVTRVDLEAYLEAKHRVAWDAVLKFLSSPEYLQLRLLLEESVTTAQKNASLPLNPENYFNKINKRIRKSLIALRSASASEIKGEFITSIERAQACINLLQISSATWTTGQLELRATLAELNQRAQEIAQEHDIQMTCSDLAQELEDTDLALGIGFLCGKSSYYESGLGLAFASFAKQELDLMKKLKLK